MSSSALTWRERALATWRRRGWRGFHSLQRLLLGRGSATILAETRYGSRFLLDPASYIDDLVLREGFYESEVLEALRAALARGGVLWDVGANFGLHAITAQLLCPAAVVCAFEPAPAMMTRLQQNTALNASELRCFALALSDADGIASLHHGPEGNAGMSTLSPWRGFTYSTVCQVATRRGDALVAGAIAPVPNVLKIDVEGHEAAVLRGLETTLRNPACRIVVFEDGQEEESAAKALLRAAGFQLRALPRRESSAHSLANYLAEKP